MVGRRAAGCKPLLGALPGVRLVPSWRDEGAPGPYWSEADGVFVAEVPELPGCMAPGGPQQAALDHVNQAMALWIDTAEEFGDPVPEPKGERLMLA